MAIPKEVEAEGGQGNTPSFYSTTKKFQFLAAAAATFGAFGLGTALGWSSPALSDMSNDEKWTTLTKGDKSWIGAILTLGALLSGPCTGFLIGKIGRRTTMMFMSAPFLLGWLLIIFAQNVWMLLIGRFLAGFCGGSFSLSAPVYIGEIAEGSVRGILGSAFQFMLVLGVLFSFVVGAFVNWYWLSIICAFIPVILLIFMAVMPESPRYLLTVQKHQDAAKALAWFRGAEKLTLVEPELQSIQDSVDEVQRNQASFADLLQPALLKPTLISLGLMLFQQLSGINAVVFYTEQIFLDAGSTMSSALSAIIVALVQVFATMASMILVDRLGRKILLIVSEIFMAISLVALGIFFLMKYNEEQAHNAVIGGAASGFAVMESTTEFGWETVSEKTLAAAATEVWIPDVVKNLGWLPLASLVGFVTAFSIGFGPIPWMLLGEILPPKAIGLASSLSASSNWTIAFLVTMSFETIKDAITIQWAYFSFAIICCVGILYVIFLVPETKGKTLDEIQAIFGDSSSGSRAARSTGNLTANSSSAAIIDQGKV